MKDFKEMVVRIIDETAGDLKTADNYKACANGIKRSTLESNIVNDDDFFKFYGISKEEGIRIIDDVLNEFISSISVGRPSLGVTKKVSITLPEEIWNMIEQRKEELGVSQSQTLRMMIESYFRNDSQ